MSETDVAAASEPATDVSVCCGCGLRPVYLRDSVACVGSESRHS